MIEMEIKILIKDVIINESGHLSTFQYVFFEFDSTIFKNCVL
jgi:hypothetical protein